MRTWRWGAPGAIGLVGILALVLLLAPSGKDPAQATSFGLGPTGGLPYTGTDVGVNLCDITFTTVLNVPTGTALVAFDDLTPNFEKHDDTGTTANFYEAGEGIYKDADDNNVVSIDDTRLNDVAGYDVGSTVALDADGGNTLVAFDDLTPNFELHDRTVVDDTVYDVGEGIYNDLDDSGTVSDGDTRLTKVGVYLAGSTVVETDATPGWQTGDDTDVGSALVAFASNELHDRTVVDDAVYDVGEGVYLDADTSGDVSLNDVRLTEVGAYDAGSTVGDTDIGTALVAFDDLTPNFEKHTDPNTDNVYDEGEAVFRDADDSGTVSSGDVNLLGYADPDFVGASSGTKDFTNDCFTNATNTADASPDYLQEFLIPDPGANFAAIVTFAPSGSYFAPGPGHRDPLHVSYPDVASEDFDDTLHPDLGAVMGAVSSDPVVLSLSLGGGMSPCNQSVVVEFTMMNATVDFLNDAGTAVDDNDVIWQKSFEVAAGEGNFLEPLSQPDPATTAPNQLPLHVTKFPGYLMELLDPDLLNPEMIDIDDPGGPKTFAADNGTKLPIQPLARYSGRALVAGSDQILEFMVFNPGQLAELGELENHPYAQMGEVFGYPTFVVLNAPNVAVSPSSIQDFCAPLGSITLLEGTAQVNQGTAGCAGDSTGADSWELSCVNTPRTDGTTDNIRYKNPGSGEGILSTNTNLYLNFVVAQRDADDDGIENNMDSCPLDDNSIGGSDPWYARLATPGDGDNDGLPLPCDSNDSLIGGGYEINEDEKSAGGDPGASPPVGSEFFCTTCVDSSTDTTVTVTGVTAWADDEFVNRIAVTPLGGQQLVISNTSDTLTLASEWIANPLSGSLSIFGDTLGNRQDNCPTVVNQGQFEEELVSAYPEDAGPRTDSMGDLCDPNETTADGHYHATLDFSPFCVSTDLNTDDSDGDGWCGATEGLLGSCATDTPDDCETQGFVATTLAADSTPESIYLDIRYGLARQSLMNRAPGCPTPYSPACTTMPVDVYGNLARPFINKCEPASGVCDEPGAVGGGGAHVPVGTTTNPYPHPDTGEPVGAIAMSCSDGVDSDRDGDADREDTNCKISLPPSNSPNWPNLTTAMKADLDLFLPDQDNDGEASWKEILRHTDPLNECPKTGLNNDALDPWTFDIDDSAKISGSDVFAIFPEWMKTEATNSFNYRFDLDGSGKISGGDVFAIFPQWMKEAQTEFSGSGCPPP